MIHFQYITLVFIVEYFIKFICISVNTLSAECPSKFQEFDDSCYLLGKGKKTFNKATAACKQLGGFLVEPRSEEMSTAVKSNFNFKDIWIGLLDVTRDRTFVWQSDSEALSYSNWDEDQPNNSKGKESCVVLGKNGRWNDIKCESKFEFLCQAHKSKLFVFITDYCVSYPIHVYYRNELYV